jgi:hypothetical protein
VLTWNGSKPLKQFDPERYVTLTLARPNEQYLRLDGVRVLALCQGRHGGSGASFCSP